MSKFNPLKIPGCAYWYDGAAPECNGLNWNGTLKTTRSLVGMTWYGKLRYRIEYRIKKLWIRFRKPPLVLPDLSGNGLHSVENTVWGRALSKTETRNIEKGLAEKHKITLP